MRNIKLMDGDAVTAILGVPEKTNSSYGNWRVWCEVTLNNKYVKNEITQRAMYFWRKKQAQEWVAESDKILSHKQGNYL